MLLGATAAFDLRESKAVSSRKGGSILDYKRSRAKKRRKLARNIRKMLKAVLLIPGKFPPVGVQTVEVATKVCETFGVFFVGTLIAHLLSESPLLTAINFGVGAVFFGLLIFIKLADYQDRLIKENMSNYIYIR